MECSKSTNIFYAILLSFFSARFYREVAKCWRAKSFLYLFIVLAICWVAVAAVRSSQFLIFAEKSVVALSTQMPVIHLKEGVASTAVKSPVYIKWPDSQRAIIVVDTDNQIKDFHKTEAMILIQHNEFKVKTSGTEVRSYPYDKDLTMVFGPDQMQLLFKKVHPWIFPFMFIVLFFFGLIFSYLYRFVQSLIYALFGLIFVAALKRSLDYVAVLNVALIAITPAIVLNTLSIVFNLFFPFEWLVFFLLSMGYLIFGIKSTERIDEQSAASGEVK